MLSRAWRIRLRRIAIAVFEIGVVCAALVLAFVIRFDGILTDEAIRLLTRSLPIAIVLKLAIFRLLRLDRLGWRHFGIADLRRLVFAVGISSLVFGVAAYLYIGSAFPRSVYVLDLLLCFLLKSAGRLSARLYIESKTLKLPRAGARHILVYGAGSAGMTLLREIRSNQSLNYRVVGLIDDDAHKRGQIVLGVPVLGVGREVPAIVDQIRGRGVKLDEIIVAMPSVSGERIREALANCRAAQLECKTVPGMGELLTGKVLTTQVRNVSVEDLLGREAVHLDESGIRRKIEGRAVLVTGGAGSIGSEICRQVASFGASCVVIFDRAESDLYRIQLEMERKFPNLEVIPHIGDMRDYRAIDYAMRHFRIQSVFHAAAYKHVPMMEAHLVEAVHNNVCGTHNVVNAAKRNGVADFLMISTDKAVNPTNIMGLTKRVAEQIVGAMASPAEGGVTNFVSVRFGNVLNSNGSVVPLFREQIAAGGPVTVTHPEIRRYFMTIREAVQLVLQASTMGKGSEIFVLDMGEPVRIVDLARNMIRLCGKETEIEVRFTGLRPGEKLYEELITEGENVAPTYHEKIRIFNSARRTQREMEAWIARCEQLVDENSPALLLRHMQSIVPEYLPATQWSRILDETSETTASVGSAG